MVVVLLGPLQTLAHQFSGALKAFSGSSLVACFATDDQHTHQEEQDDSTKHGLND
jgi:hypothetical protein